VLRPRIIVTCCPIISHIYQFGMGYRNTLYWQVDRFVIGRRKVEKIFVDETLLKTDGQNYCWLWLAYNPSLHVYLLFHLSTERTIFVCYQ
jgi:transposase-like protein